MKYLLFISLFCTIAVSCSPKELPTVFEQSEGYAAMKVSHQTTKKELDEMAVKLAAQNIQMDYSSSSFFDDGKLQNLHLIVVTPDGSKGKTTADLVILQFKYFGFIYQKNGGESLKIGEI